MNSGKVRRSSTTRRALAALLATYAAIVPAVDGRTTTPPPAAFPEGFESLASQSLKQADMTECRIDCESLYKASELWLAEENPVKRLYAKIRLQGLLFQFYSPSGEKILEGADKIGRPELYTRFMEILAGGDLTETEVRAKDRGKRITVTPVEWTEIRLEETPKHIHRNNCGDMNFIQEDGDAYLAPSLYLSANPVSPERFQVFAGPPRGTAGSTVDALKDKGLVGFLFDNGGTSLARFEEQRAVAACFDASGGLLAVETKPLEDESKRPHEASWSLRSVSPTGKTVWSSPLSFPTQEEGEDYYPSTPFWAVWPSAESGSWTVELIDSGFRGWFESAYLRWVVDRQPSFALKGPECWFLEESEDRRQEPMAAASASFRFDRSSPYGSYDAQGRYSFLDGGNRHSSWPLVIKGYPSPVQPSFNRVFEQNGEPGSITTQGLDALILPQTGFFPFRGTWPRSANFFVASDAYWPVFGHFMNAREGAADADQSNEDYLPLSGEQATFFYDKTGNFLAWTMGYVAGDAADGESLLVARSDGRLLTISPEGEIKDMRRFIMPDGGELKPVLVLDENSAGIFLSGKNLLLAKWGAGSPEESAIKSDGVYPAKAAD